MKKNFIKVSDIDTMSALVKLGYQIVDTQNGVYTFLNDDKLCFSDNLDLSKIKYSNMLYV